MGSEIAEAAGKKAGTESGKAAGKAEGLRLAQEAVQEEIKKMGGAGQLFDASQSTGKCYPICFMDLSNTIILYVLLTYARSKIHGLFLKQDDFPPN